VDVAADKVLYRCWHCGFSGAEFQKKQEEGYPYVAEIINLNQHPDLHDTYLFGRGISRETANKYEVGSADQYIRAAGTTTKCVVFPYFDTKGKKYGSKYRAIDVKGFSCSAALQDLWRIDLVDTDKSPDIIITEGEIDALSIAECGFYNVVSIPNGAAAVAAKPVDEPLPYIWNARDTLDKAKRIILAGDADKPGEENQAEIARRIGKHRVWRVVWPEGIKDANDALVKLGADKLRELVEGAEPWPVSGLYDAGFFFDRVKDIRENGLPPGASTGYPLVDDYYTVAPGLLTVVTGIPNSGKSEWVDQIMCNLAERDGWRFAVCSFENPPPLHITKLVSKRVRLNAWDHSIPVEQFDQALAWVQQHFSFLYQDDGSLSDLDSIIERLRVAVMRYGIRGAVVDPYNYIQRSGNQSETDWISDMLTKLKAFCMAHGVHLFFVAHPTKMRRDEEGNVAIPTGYDISGSAHFFNKADCGITVHREEGSVIVAIKVWKIRFAWQGKLGKVSITYDPITTVYDDGSPKIDMNDPLLITSSEEEWIRYG
jgi:twinkle protein